MADDVNTENFDLFLPLMPQSGSSKIVFASNRDGSMQIYVMNADGSGQTRLTYSGANDDYPRWSPSGSKIVFQSDRDNPDTGFFDIYVMNADGSGQTRLTTDPNDDSAAVWSPDGSKIAFQSARNSVNYQIYVMNADGSGQMEITGNTTDDTGNNNMGSNGQPAWCPDGTKIAFTSDRDDPGTPSVYVMNVSGLNQTRLTFDYGTRDEQPAWSPNGAKLAFVSTRDSTVETWQETDDDGNVITKSKLRVNKEVYVMNANGSNLVRLTNTLANDDSPSWSGDGTKIVFRSDRERDCCDPTAQVWTMNQDGSNQTNLSSSSNGDYSSSSTSASGNQSPVANAGGSYRGVIAQNVVFSGAGSFDSDGSITSYSWSFGDGGTGSGVSPIHPYSAAGTYNVTLTVTDNLGAQGSATTTVSISSSSSDQFVQNFLQRGLARPPTGDESSYWTDIMRSAYAQGQGSMRFAIRELGMTIFESTEYAARNRSDHEYVYDLYRTFLMREPEEDGWTFWTEQASPLHMGRENVRYAFDGCIECSGIVSTLTASGAPSSAVSSLATARVDPFNQTGNQLQARDCEWGLMLLSLPGRAGLDLGLGLSYSSLVWTRSGPYVYFDEDRGSPSPGFRFGFATIQGPHFDAQVGRNVYMLITSSGHRVELRQVGTSTVYEAADSSYLQLTAGGNLSLRTTDGTQMIFGEANNEWHCTQIEDRNGNLINVNYDGQGDITTITDTLGRVINLNYDSNSNLSTISQAWSGQPSHTWASFGWNTLAMQPSFGVEVVGTHSGESIPVLTQVGLDDGSRYNFEYTGAGQVNVVRRYTSSDTVQRSYMAYDYTGSDDCPRITDARVWAENWNGINDVPNEVVTYFSEPGDGSHQMTAPDGTIYKEFYGAGWQKGLPTQSEVRSGGVLQKWTTTSYVQDNTGVNYQTNPRVTEANVYDSAGNRRRNTLEYNQGYGLPTHVREYGGADGQTLLRLTTTSYKTDSAYIDRRIIGLPYERIVYDGPTGALMSRNVFYYDWGGDYLS
ncbi:MAG TPA: PKD domain-containing protein, partial [Pyrinomonadaceae bacterium]|nr:PKD domain-containing protein [Pyrinomonadaceae bacterium]